MMLQNQKMWVGGLAIALAAAGTHASSQSTLPATPSPQQSVPNAPTPQTLPNLNTITPVQPALPSAPAPATPASNTPQTPAPASAADVQDQGPAPDLPTPGQGPSEANRLHLNVQFVEIPFLVKDSKNKIVPGITIRDVRVFENNVQQHISYFSADPFPLSIALVIDQSVTFDTMEKINASLSALQGAFTPFDEIAVFTYNNGVKKQTDFTAAQSARLGVVLDRSKGAGREPTMGLTGPLTQTTIINNQQVDPNTTAQRGQQGITLNTPREYHTLNDAIFEAAQETAKAPRGRRRIVYVISDGKEYGSKVTQKEVIRYLQTNNIILYATLVGDSSLPGMGFLDRIHIPLTMRDDVLPKYTAATGGGFDPEFRPKGIEQSFMHIGEEVRAQYTVGYITHAPPLDEKFRNTMIRVMRPGLTIIAPDGYYPSAFSRPSRPIAATSPATQ